MSNAFCITNYIDGLLDTASIAAHEARLIEQVAEDFTSNQMPYPLFDTDAAKGLTELNHWVASTKQKASKLMVLGTGGSSLGGQALVAFMQGQADVEFIANIDPATLNHCVEAAKRDDVHWLIISKSGGTLETITQAVVVLDALGEARASEAATIITSDKQNPLHDLAAHYGVPCMPHPDLGGRFSLFSNVALLPALWAGLDCAALLKGATDYYAELANAPTTHAALKGAALQAVLMKNYPMQIIMPYCDRLETLASWFKQLWAESLGKEGHGSTPVRALGTVDQHSQLQLYLEGPADKFFTLICVDNAGDGPRINAPLEGQPWDMLNGHYVGDVMQASQAGTIESLRHHEKLLRVVDIPKLDAAALGALAMHFMLETVLTAKLLGINAYDQPAVEDGKARTRAHLKNPKAEVA